MIVTSLQTWPAQASAYHPVFRRALEFIARHDFRHEKPGKIDIIPGKLFCLLQEMDSVPFSDARPESHRQFIDIQYLISGHEVMGVSSVSSGKHSVVEDRTPEQDILFWQVNEDENPVTLTPGMFAIFFPDDIHRPCAHQPSDAPCHLRKAVIKIHRELLEETV